MHDPNKVMLGSSESSDRDISNEPSDPASFPAGVCVRRDEDGALSLLEEDGSLLGVSMGESLSDTKKTAVCRAGNRVPVLLTNEGAFSSAEIGDLTFTAVEPGEAGDDISIILLDDEDAGNEHITIDELEITIHMEDGASTAQQIYDAVTQSQNASALVTVEIAEGEEEGTQPDAGSQNLEGGEEPFDYVVIGQPLIISATTGMAISDTEGAVTTGATYVSLSKKGVNKDGSLSFVALVDMGGGL